MSHSGGVAPSRALVRWVVDVATTSICHATGQWVPTCDIPDPCREPRNRVVEVPVSYGTHSQWDLVNDRYATTALPPAVDLISLMGVLLGPAAGHRGEMKPGHGGPIRTG